MKTIYNTLLILAIFIRYPTFGQNSFKSISVDSDTINASFIKDIINNDSISILEFQKIKYPDMPDQVDERLVYVDYKKSTLAEEIMKSRDQLSKIFLGESYLMIQRTIEKKYIINPYKEISNTYIEIHKLNNEYILFLPDFDHLKMITDSAFIYKDDEGLLFYYFNDISK